MWYESLKIATMSVGFVSAVLAFPLKMIITRYNTILTEHTKHSTELINLNLNRVKLEGDINALKTQKISREELDRKMEKLENNILKQMKSGEERTEKAYSSISSEIQKLTTFLLHKKD